MVFQGAGSSLRCNPARYAVRQSTFDVQHFAGGAAQIGAFLPGIIACLDLSEDVLTTVDNRGSLME
jgi:hypothetical protein